MEPDNKTYLINEDLNHISNSACIAIYDSLKAPPRIITINPTETDLFIENLSSTIYDEAHKQNGEIPYTVIREICENFIHAYFSEIVVSILDNGNTIRFADQGPGFTDINKAKLPGFTSATNNMKKYIRGVGSGLPTVCDYIKYSEGQIRIENNLNNGAVVTISVLKNLSSSVAFSEEDKKESDLLYQQKISKLTPPLTEREHSILSLLYSEGALGVTQINKYLNIPPSSIHKTLCSLEQNNLVEKAPNKKRILSNFGFEVCKQF